MTTKQGGVPIAGFMTTTDDVDIYPTHLDELGKGGLHSEQDIIGRDAITPERRSEGMLCYIIDDLALYQLSGGIDNINWLLIFTIIDGEVVINQTLPDNYIYHGNILDEVVKSPILLDTRLEILRIKAGNFILGRPNEQLNSAQVLSALQDGYMHNDGGTVTIKTTIPSSDITLSEGKVFLGDSSNMATEVQRLELDNLPSMLSVNATNLLGVYNLWTGSANPLTLAEPTQTLSIQQCNLANLTVGKIWFGAAILPTEDPLNFGFNRPKEVDKLPTDFLEVPFNKVIIGDVFDRASAQERVEINNMATLKLDYIWRGDINGNPEESYSLTTLELIVDEIQDVTIPAIEADILTLQGQVSALEAAVAAVELEVGEIQGQVLLLEGAVVVLQGQVLVIQGQIDAVNTTIANLRLNNILADANVSFYNYRLTDLANPINPLDGVNLQTVASMIGSAAISDAKVILQTSNVNFPNGQRLDTLPTGVLKSTTMTGVISIDTGLTSISTASTQGAIYRTATNTFATRTIEGTANEIVITNGDGVLGNPTIGIAPNPVLTGSDSVMLPKGSNFERSGDLGSIRYNSQNNFFEGCNQKVGFEPATPIWRVFVQILETATNGFITKLSSNTYITRNLTGVTNEIDITNSDGVSGNPTIGIANNPVLTGNATITGDLRVDGIITGERPAAELYWISNTLATAVSERTWTKLQTSAFGISHATQFTGGANTSLVFTGEDNTRVQLILSCRFRDTVQTDPTIGISLYKDGVRILNSTKYVTAFGTGRSCYIGCNAMSTLNNLSEVDVYIWAASATSIIGADVTLDAFAI